VHCEETHASVAPHAMEHPPQWIGSAVVSTQLSPHCVNGGVHDPTHTPAWHSMVVPAHAFAQAPQFMGSLESSVQTPAQLVSSWGHTHAPPAHVVPFGQVLPHSPQFDASVDVLMHD
jgi:hypothetical protein